jgi:hypothetical protein
VTLHLIKLCVGCDTVEDLLAWREASKTSAKPWILRTRQTPRRASELIDGGSLYRVYRGFILSRQRIEAVRTIGAGVAARCEIDLSEEVVLTVPTARRPFQGWRYLEASNIPADLAMTGSGPSVPAGLARRLREIGAW